MNKTLRKFLEANGLRGEATEKEAWAHVALLQGRGIPFPAGIPEKDMVPVAEVETETKPESDNTRNEPAQPVQTKTEQTGPSSTESKENRAELERIKVIRSYAESFKVKIKPEWISDPSFTGEKLRTAVSEVYAEQHAPFGGGTGSRGMDVGADPVAKIQEPMIHGLMMRAGYGPMRHNERGELEKAPLAEGYQRFRRMSLMQMAREFVEAQGYSNVRSVLDEDLCRMMLNGETQVQRNDPFDLSTRGGAISPSDFPNLLNNIVSQIVESYTLQQEREWLQAVRVRQIDDFRPQIHKRYKFDALLGQGSDMDKWPLLQLEDSGESWAIKPHGIKMVTTLPAMLGNDFNILTEGPLHMMNGMFATERFMFYDFLNSTDLMSDGKPLFHADHGNLATVDITRGDLQSIEDALFAAELRMSEQKYTVKGNDIGYIPAPLKTIFHSTKDNKEFSKLTLNPQLSSTSEPNGYNNKWYQKATVARPEVGDQMIAVSDPNQFPCIEAGWLFGDQSLRMGSQTSYTGWQTETVGWTAFGMGRVGYVGIDKTVVA